VRSVACALPLPLPGDVAEWLRSGLQSRLHRFDSGRRLTDGCPFSFQLGCGGRRGAILALKSRIVGAGRRPLGRVLV
jgi:hypothetical protein